MPHGLSSTGLHWIWRIRAVIGPDNWSSHSLRTTGGHVTVTSNISVLWIQTVAPASRWAENTPQQQPALAFSAQCMFAQRLKQCSEQRKQWNKTAPRAGFVSKAVRPRCPGPPRGESGNDERESWGNAETQWQCSDGAEPLVGDTAQRDRAGPGVKSLSQLNLPSAK